MKKFLTILFLITVFVSSAFTWHLTAATQLKLEWRQYFSHVYDDQDMVKMVISPTGDIFVLIGIGHLSFYLMKFDNYGNLVLKVPLSNNSLVEYCDMVLDKYGKIYLLGDDLYSVFLVRYGNDGQLLSRTFVAQGEEVSAMSLCLDDIGDVYVLWEDMGFVYVAMFGRRGYSVSRDGHGATLNAFDVIEPLWKTFLGECVWIYTMGIVIDKTGNLYVGGTSDITWGNPLRPYQGSYDGFLAKLDGNGQLVWNTFIGGWGSDIFFGIACNEQGNVSLVGQSSDEWGDPVRSWSGPSGGWNANTFIAKLDSNGQLLWNTFLGNGNEGISCYSLMWGGIAMDEQVSIYVTGVSAGSWGNPLWNFPGGKIWYDGYVAKVDQYGHLLWHSFLPLRMRTDIKFGEARPLVLWQGSIYVAGISATYREGFYNNYGFLDKITEVNGQTKLRIEHWPPEK